MHERHMMWRVHKGARRYVKVALWVGNDVREVYNELWRVCEKDCVGQEGSMRGAAWVSEDV